MKRPHIKNIIFDFDGTLVDTAPLIVKTMREAMRQMNLPEKNEAESARPCKYGHLSEHEVV